MVCLFVCVGGLTLNTTEIGKLITKICKYIACVN